LIESDVWPNSLNDVEIVNRFGSEALAILIEYEYGILNEFVNVCESVNMNEIAILIRNLN
jgi:hypothetical protein